MVGSVFIYSSRGREEVHLAQDIENSWMYNGIMNCDDGVTSTRAMPNLLPY